MNFWFVRAPKQLFRPSRGPLRGAFLLRGTFQSAVMRRISFLLPGQLREITFLVQIYFFYARLDAQAAKPRLVDRCRRNGASISRVSSRCLSILFSVFLSKRASFEGRRPSALRAFTPSLAAEKARENAPMTACGRHGVHPPLAEAIPRALIRQGLSRHILGASRLRYSTVP